MWAKNRFSRMGEFVVKAQELGFTHIEANASLSPQMVDELIETSVPISSIHSPCPARLSSRGIPATNLALSSLDENERSEAIDFAKETIDLASRVGARAVVIHLGEVPIDLSLQDKLYWLCQQGQSFSKEYSDIREQLVFERFSKASFHVDAAEESLEELGQYSQQRGIMLGLETRFYFHEIPSIDEMGRLLSGAEKGSVGYWHDVGHAEVQQRLGFAPHEEWLLRFKNRLIGVHLHDVLGISDHRVPGRGEVNWSMIAKYLPPGVIRVCEIGEWNKEEYLPGAIPFLQEKGILT